jgi:hypothetical protein
MKFDLEFNIINFLGQKGLDKLSDLLYSDSSSLTPMKYDIKAVSLNQNKGSINTSNFNNMNCVPDHFIVSGITSTGKLSLNSILDKSGKKIPVFNGGDLTVHKDITSWSVNRIFKTTEKSLDKYLCVLDSDFDINSIDIFTTSFQFPGYFKKQKQFKYIPFHADGLLTTFKSSKEEYKYTIIDNTVHLSTDTIHYEKCLLGNIVDGSNIFALPEFPVSNLNLENMSSDDYTIYNGTIIINSTAFPIGTNVVASFEVMPIITFTQINRSLNRPDIIPSVETIDSKSINFKNGIICAYQSYDTNNIPTNLELTVVENKDIISYSEVLGIETRITNISGLPIPNKKITTKIISNNAIWQESNSPNYTSTSTIDGTIKASLVSDSSNIGLYIQKEWMSNVLVDGVLRGRITLPYIHPSIGASLDLKDKQTILNGMYLYTVQSDDPILGKYNAIYSENGVDEYYTSGNIKDYIVTGRKIAYIKLSSANNKIYSSYIKPIDISIDNDINISFRDLFIKTINGSSQFSLTMMTIPKTISSINKYDLAGKYKDGILPFDTLTVKEDKFNSVTVITYENPLPISNPDLSGAWLVSDKIIEIVSEYDDGVIKLSSNIKDIIVKSVESETPFMLTGYTLNGYDTKTQGFGYLTATEYMKNPFGIRSCSYYCIYSDAINKRCINPNIGYRKYFKLDSESIGCIHTPEYDLGVTKPNRCPGVDAHIVNPFILQVT